MACTFDRLVGGEQFRLLSAIVETKSFSKAALVLGVTQPSVSQNVKRLETIFGRPLFRRSNKGAELTAHGEAVVMYVRVMRALTQDLQRYFDDATDSERSTGPGLRGRACHRADRAPDPVARDDDPV